METIIISRRERVTMILTEFYFGGPLWKMLFRIIGGPIMFLFGRNFIFNSPDRIGVAIGGFLIAYSIYYTFYPIWFMLSKWKSYHAVEIKLKATTDKLFFQDGESESHIPYEKFEKILKRKKYYALQIQKGLKIYLPSGKLSENTINILNEKGGYPYKQKETLESYLFKSDLINAQKMIDEGANIDGEGNFLGRPILAAINSENLTTLYFLIEKGVDVNIDYGSPLSCALDNWLDNIFSVEMFDPYSDEREMVEILIKNGADIEIKNENGIGPLDTVYAYTKSLKDRAKLMSEYESIFPKHLQLNDTH